MKKKMGSRWTCDTV